MKKMTLGTAQLGLKYGINNTTGKPDGKSAEAILDMAIDRGIRSFDTASAYGDAEVILGQYIESRNLIGKVEVVTKLSPKFQMAGLVNVSAGLTGELKKSLQRLRLSSVDAYLMHNPKHMYDVQLLEALTSAKELGLISRIGVSVYSEEDAVFAAQSDSIGQIQIPYSIFDQRLDRGPFFDIVKENGTIVHARSAFLQGLMLMSPEKLPPHLSAARPLIEKLNEISSSFNISIQAMALLFPKANEGISHVVFGADNCEQLAANADIFLDHNLQDDLLSVLRHEFHKVNPYIIDPSKWS